MVQTIDISELRKVIAFSDMPDELLQWVIDHSTYMEYEEGTGVMKTGDTIDDMIIIIEGKIDFYMDVNGKLVYFHTFGNTPETGGVTGMLPYSRMKGSPGSSFAKSKVRGLRLHKSHFIEMERLFPDFIQRLIGYMTERARTFATTQLQHEKVNALGKLSAGIAHELNNPAAAINRIAEELQKRLKMNFPLTEKLLQAGVNPEQVKILSTLMEDREKEIEQRGRLSVSMKVQLEGEITDWLDDNGLSENLQAGETFTEAGFTVDDFETIRHDVGKEAFVQVLNWMENLLGSERLMKDLENASGRISKLVGAIKSHVHMDRTSEVECCTDIHKDIDNTLTLLGYKLREKNIRITRQFNDDVPEVEAYIGELNQVWTNIIDNAIFALDKEGELSISTSSNQKDVTISIRDNGPGIPKDIISRVFDPFFTTKKVGEGTGIGLDLVKRIINRHNGEIKVRSVPGNTEFEICIPIRQKQAAKT